MEVDTALFLVAAGESKEDSTLVGFTESKDKEVRSEFKRLTFFVVKCSFLSFLADPLSALEPTPNLLLPSLRGSFGKDT